MLEYLDRPIAFHRSFVNLGIGITGALLLSQALYWSKRTKHDERWFYKTQDEWSEETGMTRREIDTARGKLRKLGILLEKKQGIPCRLHYKINEPILIGLLEQTSLAESVRLDVTKEPGCAAQKCQTITENTQRLTETTKHSDRIRQTGIRSQRRENMLTMNSKFGLPEELKR
ncbi:hypothetical protein [Vibrio viridaestus]|uniref:Uncharacterized protein n=1 Tax=Vibrio viridaestus TaxID=2487322 RepID=A0A3N9TAT6_9VIBR|nr:hypothetical protein [Vibrio viridaestus]RQW61169.1 hypothetical protein EES38_20550 [Vibrio viridaestus]